ncbi:MAG: GNAT family N-acetyltransferase [Ruminococcus sp.]|nr:GNAT family N-acetyltransferase [Ruminococcus sp.]
MIIRNGQLSDLDEIALIEKNGFAEGQAASREALKARLEVFPEYFYLLCDDDGRIVSFADGFVTNEKDLSDEMYQNASWHDKNGSWQMVFGLNTIESERRKGYAATVLERLISTAKAEGRLGVVLTCKEALIPFYGKFGFKDEGVTGKSYIAGIKWHQMRLVF